MKTNFLLLSMAFMAAHPNSLLAKQLDVDVASAIYQNKERTVKGVVLDDQGPVPGASVIVKGTTRGTMTDFDGNFVLNIPKGATIIVSFVGYADKEIVYKGEANLKINLKEDVTALQEVQVIAYGATKKATITGALASVKTDEIMKSPVANVANALSGKIPGLSSVQSSGQPGADGAQIYVRGVGSLNEGLSSPLCLVDGVERPFSQIDANEIEDITVLKDASATAVFGVRGANGVILVTTKRGQQGKAKISFSTNVALQLPSRIPEFANSYDYATVFNDAQRHDGVDESSLMFSPDQIEAFRDHTNPILYPDTDWTDLLIKNHAIQTQHNLNISGGTDRVKYFASLGVFTQDGLFETFDTKDYNSGFKFNRYNYRINMDVKVTNTTTAKINLGGRLTDKREPNYDNGTYEDVKYLFRDIYQAVPFSSPGLVDGKYVAIHNSVFAGWGTMSDGLHPYYDKGYNTRNQNTINFDFTLEQKLDVLTKGLKLHLKGAYNSGVTITKRREKRPEKYEARLGANGETILEKVGEDKTLGYAEGSGQSRDWYLEAALNYKRNFGDHHVTALAMYNQSKKYYFSNNYPGIPRSYLGFVGRATYDYKTKYLLDFSIGYNGSENFAEGQRFGVFPAGSIGWILSEEKFMESLKPYVSYLKLRASYGIVGNDRVSDGSRFIYLPDSYILSTGSYAFGVKNKYSVNGAKESKVGNPNVTWETAAKQNYGIDIQFLDSRLKASFDYFIEHRKDILISRKVNPNYLGISLPIANLGKVDNKGYEFTLRWEDKINEVRYNIGTGWAYAKNKIVYQDEVPQPYEWMERTGRPVGQQFGYKYDGFFTQEDVDRYNSDNHGGIPDHGFSPRPGDVKYKDLNKDNVINEKDVAAIGNPRYPLLTGNLNMGISWKGFDFSMTWSGAFKTSRYLSDMYRRPFGVTGRNSLMTYMIKDAWTPEVGNSAKAPAISLSNSMNYVNSDLWLRDASYVRLKNVEVGYSFPKKWLEPLKLSNLRLSMSGYNLLTFDKLDVCDPEANPDGLAYPLIKVVNFGLKAVF